MENQNIINEEKGNDVNHVLCSVIQHEIESSNKFLEQIQEEGWINSAKGMQGLYLRGLMSMRRFIYKKIVNVDVQQLRGTSSDAEFRRKLYQMIGYY